MLTTDVTNLCCARNIQVGIGELQVIHIALEGLRRLTGLQTFDFQ